MKALPPPKPHPSFETDRYGNHHSPYHPKLFLNHEEHEAALKHIAINRGLRVEYIRRNFGMEVMHRFREKKMTSGTPPYGMLTGRLQLICVPVVTLRLWFPGDPEIESKLWEGELIDKD